MAKNQTNNLRWRADLVEIDEDVDQYDRPVVIRTFKRKIYYEDIGITAEEKYLSLQRKTEVVRRIKVRLDRSITEKNNGITIAGVEYNITRIFTKVDKREMELSLAYVE